MARGCNDVTRVTSSGSRPLAISLPRTNDLTRCFTVTSDTDTVLWLSVSAGIRQSVWSLSPTMACSQSPSSSLSDVSGQSENGDVLNITSSSSLRPASCGDSMSEHDPNVESLHLSSVNSVRQFTDSMQFTRLCETSIARQIKRCCYRMVSTTVKCIMHS